MGSEERPNAHESSKLERSYCWSKVQGLSSYHVLGIQSEMPRQWSPV